MRRFFLLFLLIGSVVTTSHAVTLDWDGVACTAGTLDNPYDIDRSKAGNSDMAADPTYQHDAMHDITFTPIPEINPAWTAVGSCLVAAALILRHSAKFRK